MENTLIPGVLLSLLSLGCLIVFFAGLKKALTLSSAHAATKGKVFAMAIAAVLAWIGLLGVLSLIGFFRDFTNLPPRLLLFLVPAFFIVLLISFSKGFTALLKSVPPEWLVFFQAFRILVELLLWFAFSKGMIPEQMTFDGYNFDIVSGVLALPVGWMLARRTSYARAAGIAYNVIGLLLLFNILTIAVLSMPTPFRKFMNDPANTIVAEFPFVYLPGVLVIFAFAFHVFSLRQLLRYRPVKELEKRLH